MKTTMNSIARLRRAFTLVELITAMAITSILVVIIMQLTSQGITLWKAIRDDTSTASGAKVALQAISRDLESIQLRSTTDNTEWMYAEVDSAIRGVPRGLSIPKSARCIFYACVPDRNPAVSDSSSLRNSYRNLLASSADSQGDVSAVSYRLKFRDHVLNLPSRKGDLQSYPLFSLYRHVVSPRDTFDQMLGTDNLEATYNQFASSEDKSFLCENIVELNVILNVEYADESSGNADQEVMYRHESVPILSTAAGESKRKFRLYGMRAESEGHRMENARILSAEVSITVLTEAGVALIQQVRIGQRRPPKMEEFFSKYTRSYSQSVPLPLPL